MKTPYFRFLDRHRRIVGSLRSYDGYCNENVTFNIELFVWFVLRLFQVGRAVQNKRSALSLAWHEWFSCKSREWKIYYRRFTLSSGCLKWKFHLVVWQITSKNCTKKRAARAARLFFCHSTNQIIDLWRFRCCCRHRFLNFLLTRITETFA